jgi:hypothetical protein
VTIADKIFHPDTPLTYDKGSREGQGDRGPAPVDQDRSRASTGRVMLALRPIGQNDYNVVEDGQRIGRIRYASERTPGAWLWFVQVHIPGPPIGSERSLNIAKREFKKAWLEFKAKHGPRNWPMRTAR